MAAERAHVSIGDVLAELKTEFPDVTISKIRFLESQGLVNPERTPSGYRRFYPADVERLRWILRQQKEHFLPLKVIKERLAEYERRGEPLPEHLEPLTATPALFESPRAEHEGTGGGAKDAGDVEQVVLSTSGASLTRAELARAAGLEPAQLAALEEYGLLAPSQSTDDHALFDEDALTIARAAAGFMQHGIEPRHLRMYRAFADREASLFEQVLLAYRRRRNPEAQAQAEQALGELATLGRRLRTALLRQAVRRGFTPR